MNNNKIGKKKKVMIIQWGLSYVTHVCVRFGWFGTFHVTIIKVMFKVFECDTLMTSYC